MLEVLAKDGEFFSEHKNTHKKLVTTEVSALYDINCRLRAKLHFILLSIVDKSTDNKNTSENGLCFLNFFQNQNLKIVNVHFK